jgi:FMN phosphatase YigB (HAD superfamily)
MTLPFDPQAIDAIFFDMDGTLIETDDLEVLKWEGRISRMYRQPEHAENAARRIVMGLETPANAVFTVLDLFGLDRLAFRLLDGSKRGHHAEE